MKTLRAFLIIVALAMAWGAPAFAQNSPPGWAAIGGSVPLAVTSTSSNVALPGSPATPKPPNAKVCNTGTVPAYIAFGGAGVVAYSATSGPNLAGSYLPAGVCQLFAPPGSATNVAAVTASGVTTLTIESGTGSPQSSITPGSGLGMATDASNAILPAARNTLMPHTVTALYYAKDYGTCTWDGAHDVVSCINLASAAANADGGGRVVVPAGSFGQTTPILQYENVDVIFAGGANYGRCGSKLTWLGAVGGVMVTGGADADDATIKTRLIGVCLDGAGTAATGVKLRSLAGGVYEDVYLTGVTADGWDIDAATASGAITTGFNWFLRTKTELTSAASLNANGWRIGQQSTAGADTTRNIWIDMLVLHQNGAGFICGFMDSNYVYGAHVEPVSGGTGASLVLKGSSGSDKSCFNNRFEGEFGVNNVITSQVSAEAGAFPSHDNYLLLNQVSGAPDPLIEAGASLTWDTFQGFEHHQKEFRNITVSSFTIGTFEIGRTFTNIGAGMTTNANLPPATVGQHYCWARSLNQWTVTANGTDVIAVGGSSTVSGGNVTIDSNNGVICLESPAAGLWAAVSATGTWTVN